MEGKEVRVGGARGGRKAEAEAGGGEGGTCMGYQAEAEKAARKTAKGMTKSHLRTTAGQGRQVRLQRRQASAAVLPVLATALKPHRPIPGHSMAARRAIQSSHSI